MNSFISTIRLVGRWLVGLARRRRARLVAAALGVAVAVGLLASIGTFLSSSKATMTQRAASSVSVDWQVEVQPGADPAKVLATVTAFGGLRSVSAVRFARTTGFSATAGGSTQTTGAGVVLGLPAAYADRFPSVLRPLTGRTAGVLLAQQTAANLHAAPGDTVTIGRAGMADAKIRIDAIVDLPSADSLFQKVGAPIGAQPQAPPDNVLLVPDTVWHGLFDQLAIARPDLVTTQVHADVVSKLPTDPSQAFTSIENAARNLELRLAGGGLVGNNLGAELGKARSDSLYAQVLFLFLGVPGAVLAALLTAMIAAAGSDRRRRDQALLRARGATTRQLVSIGFGEAALVAVGGSAVGLAIAGVIGRFSFRSADIGATGATSWGWAAAAVLAGFVIAAVAVAWPAWRDARTLTVAAARRTVGRTSDPRWMRWGVDFLFIAAALLLFWLKSRSGYKLVLAPEGVPTISVDYWAFLAPALAWIGAGMLLWRIASSTLRYGVRPLRALLRPAAGGLAGTVAASMSRQRRLLARSLTVVALTAAFAASTSIFNATYRHQAEVDATLSNGAMVTVLQAPGTAAGPEGADRIRKVAGVRSVTALQHRYAYVGADLQDLYGVDPTTIVRATKLENAYFQGGTAQALMARLAAQPDALLVSAETVHDFQLNPGDTVRLRLQDGPTKAYRAIPFTYVGVALEFPTAPSDSFLVANASYVARMTHSNAVETFLVDTKSSDSTAVTNRIAKVVGTSAVVKDIASKRRKIGSSLTAVELAGLTRVELGFALVLAAAASGLVLWIGLTERRRTFAIASALGASTRQLGGFVWSEAVFVSGGGLVLGALTALGMSQMLVKVLTHVFDPPPSRFSLPWGYLGLVLAVMVAAVMTATAAAMRATRRPGVDMLRDL